MDGFFSKRSDAKKTLLDSEQRHSDYESMATAQPSNLRPNREHNEALVQDINNILNVNNSQNIEPATDCISRYLKALDLDYKKLNDESCKGIEFVITQVKRLLRKLEESPQQLIIESTLGEALLTLTSLSISYEDTETEAVHQLFLPLVKNEKIKDSLQKACNDHSTYPTDKKFQTENLITPSYLKQDNNPILQALQLVFNAEEKSAQTYNSDTKKIPENESIPPNTLNHASSAGGTKKLCYLCCW